MAGSYGPGTAEDTGAPPTGPERAARWLHGIALVVLLAEVVYWLAQPCAGDFLCDPVLGYVLGIAAVPFVAGLVLWVAAKRAAVLVAFDALVVGLAGPQLVTLPLTALGSGRDLVLLPLSILPLLLLGGLIGLIPRLATRRIERWIAVVALIAMTAWFATSGFLPNAIVPVVVALAIAARAYGALGGAEAG